MKSYAVLSQLQVPWMSLTLFYFCFCFVCLFRFMGWWNSGKEGRQSGLLYINWDQRSLIAYNVFFLSSACVPRLVVSLKTIERNDKSHEGVTAISLMISAFWTVKEWMTLVKVPTLRETFCIRSLFLYVFCRSRKRRRKVLSFCFLFLLLVCRRNLERSRPVVPRGKTDVTPIPRNPYYASSLLFKVHLALRIRVLHID